MVGFGFTTPLFISVMLLSQAVASKEIEVPLEAKSLDHETAYPYEPPSDLITPEVQRGLHVLFQRELEHYEYDENNHDISGNYEEVNSYLWLLGYLQTEPIDPRRKSRWNWPGNTPRPKTIAVQALTFFGKDGELIQTVMKSCRVDGSERSIKARRTEARQCSAMAMNFEEWLSNNKMLPMPARYGRIPRAIEIDQIYRFEDRTYSGLAKRKLRSLVKLAESQKWDELALLAQAHLDQHILYHYYLGLALYQQRERDEAVKHWVFFLEEANYLYPELSAYASSSLIEYFRAKGNHSMITALAEQFALENFLKMPGEPVNLLLRAAVAQLQYSLSLNLVSEPRIATALRELIELQELEFIKNDVDLDHEIDEQLQSLLQKISEVGSASRAF